MNDDRALSELQTWMAELFRRRRALPKEPELAELAGRHVTGNDRLLPIEQLEIYREQFWLRHTSSLLEDFPGLAGILGQQEWERLIEEYLLAFPPTSASLRDLGDRLALHIERSEWLPHRELCLDLARLEWAYIEAFDAADSAPLDATAIASIPEDAWENARIDLAASVRLLAVGYPVADLRRRIRTSDDSVPIPEPRAQKIVVHRLERELYDRVVSAGAFVLLSALRDGTPLVAACERAMADVPAEAAEIEASIGTWFQRWAELGWIERVRTE